MSVNIYLIHQELLTTNNNEVKRGVGKLGKLLIHGAESATNKGEYKDPRKHRGLGFKPILHQWWIYNAQILYIQAIHKPHYQLQVHESIDFVALNICTTGFKV